MASTLAAHHHFPAASTSNPGSPTFPHSQSLSLNGAGFALALRPGSAAGHNSVALPTPIPEDPQSNRTYLEFLKTWDDDQVARWLGEITVAQYETTFKQNDIRGAILLDVDQAALKEMGIKNIGDRVKITVAIKALRQKCAASIRQDRVVKPPAGMANGVRRAGSTRTPGRIPPPLHLTRSNSVSSGDRAWQPPPRSGSGSGFVTITNSSSPAATSPRTILPPALPPPSTRLPPPPSQRASPPNNISPPRIGAPSISTTAASPTNSYQSGWTGEYGLPRAPAPGNLAGGTYTARTSSVSTLDRSRSTAGIPARPATTTNAQQQHRKTASTSNLTRPATAQPSYGHTVPLSNHPYASASSPTQDGFSVTTYGRGSPNLVTPAAKLLPSPSIGQPLLSPVSEASSSSPSSLPSPVPSSTFRTYSRSSSTPVTSMNTASSLDAVMRKAVKFISEDGGSKMVAVADCTDGREVLLRVLKKFQKLGGASDGEELEGWGVYSMSSDGQSE